MMKVNFYYPYPDEWALINGQGLNAPAEWFQHYSSRRNWTVRTYLLLKEAGHDVGLVESWPEEGLLVSYSNDAKQLLKQSIPGKRALLIVSRCDTEPTPWADFEVVQNGRFSRDGHAWFIPLWPQKGLIPRDTSRGDRIERIAFKGHYGNLHQAFVDPNRWREPLEERGLIFDCDDAKEGAKESGYDHGPVYWQDYHNIDLVIAVRPNSRTGHVDKPASKLVNAWLSGVPALLGPDYAFREMREDHLDYIEIKTPEDALEQIDRLRNNPDLYRAMIEHGFKRAQAFTEEATTQRWAQVLFEEIPRSLRRPSVKLRTSLPLRLRPWVNLALRREWGGFGRRRAMAAARKGFRTC